MRSLFAALKRQDLQKKKNAQPLFCHVDLMKKIHYYHNCNYHYCYYDDDDDDDDDKRGCQPCFRFSVLVSFFVLLLMLLFLYWRWSSCDV